APPPAPSGGQLSLLPTAEGSWRPGIGWTYGTIRQGTASSYPYRGAWFYGQAATQLQGLRITGGRFFLPARERIGSFNAALIANLRIAGLSGPGDWPAGLGFGTSV